MEVHRAKTFRAILILLIAFFCGCDESFEVLNQNEPLNVSYDLKNKAIKGFDEPFLLFFYASNCGYCKEEAKYLKQVENDFKIIAIIGDKRKKNEALKYTHGLKSPIVYTYAGVDFFSSAINGVAGVPVLVFFDKNGKQFSRYNGLISLKKLQNEIKILQSI